MLSDTPERYLVHHSITVACFCRVSLIGVTCLKRYDPLQCFVIIFACLFYSTSVPVVAQVADCSC